MQLQGYGMAVGSERKGIRCCHEVYTQVNSNSMVHNCQKQVLILYKNFNYMDEQGQSTPALELQIENYVHIVKLELKVELDILTQCNETRLRPSRTTQIRLQNLPC